MQHIVACTKWLAFSVSTAVIFHVTCSMTLRRILPFVAFTAEQLLRPEVHTS